MYNSLLLGHPSMIASCTASFTCFIRGCVNRKTSFGSSITLAAGAEVAIPAGLDSAATAAAAASA